MAKSGELRAGIGGWTFEPWRGVFYPKGLRQADELNYAAGKLTAIEINGTYYATQTPESFAKWAAATPDGFVFTVKANRFATNRKILADAGESIERFLGSGVIELGDKLGPILWQFMPTKKFDPADFEAWLNLLPAKLEGRPLRHCVEVRNAAFAVPEFVALCRKHNVAICLSEDSEWPIIPDVTADFVYARLMKGEDSIPTCYPPEVLDDWAARFKTYASGGAPKDLAPVSSKTAPEMPRDVFAFIIHEAKVRAPAGAMALIERFGS